MISTHPHAHADGKAATHVVRSVDRAGWQGMEQPVGRAGKGTIVTHPHIVCVCIMRMNRVYHHAHPHDDGARLGFRTARTVQRSPYAFPHTHTHVQISCT